MKSDEEAGTRIAQVQALFTEVVEGRYAYVNGSFFSVTQQPPTPVSERHIRGRIRLEAETRNYPAATTLADLVLAKLQAATVQEEFQLSIDALIRNANEASQAPQLSKSVVRSLEHISLAEKCAAELHHKYCKIRTNFGHTLLRVIDCIATPIGEGEFFEEIATKAEGVMPRSEAEREVLPAVINRLTLTNSANFKPLLFASSNSDSIAWNRLSFDRDEKIPCPAAWSALLNNITTDTARRSFVLWVGSLLDFDSSRAQYMYMYGQGGEGKSLAAKALGVALGKELAGPMTYTLLTNTFGSSLAAGKRLVTFSEENNGGLVDSAPFKRFTGEDFLLVENKYSDPMAVPAFHKALIISNNLPSFKDSSAQKRRLIPTQWRRIDKTTKEVIYSPDVIFEKKVCDSAVQFVQYCDAEFQRWLGSAAATPPETATSAQIPVCEETYDHFFGGTSHALMDDELMDLLPCFEASDTHSVRSSAVSNIIKLRLSNTKFDNRLLSLYLNRLVELLCKRCNEDTKRRMLHGISYIKGIKLVEAEEKTAKYLPSSGLYAPI